MTADHSVTIATQRPFLKTHLDTISDKTLSDAAFRLLCWARARPPNWTYHQGHAATQLGWGKEKTQRAFRELIARGNAIKEQQNRYNGKWQSTPYTFNDVCVTFLPQPGNRGTVTRPPTKKDKKRILPSEKNHSVRVQRRFTANEIQEAKRILRRYHQEATQCCSSTQSTSQEPTA